MNVWEGLRSVSATNMWKLGAWHGVDRDGRLEEVDKAREGARIDACGSGGDLYGRRAFVREDIKGSVQAVHVLEAAHDNVGRVERALDGE
jgi:hypothetical protein